MVTRETFDDVFDDDADDDVLQQKDWRKIEKELKKDGYRDGIDTGQEVTLQKGFNQGYHQAVNICQKLGHLRGRLSAHLSWRRLKKGTPHADGEQTLTEIESLIKQISQHETHLVSMMKQLELPQSVKVDSTKTTHGLIHSENKGGSEYSDTVSDSEKSKSCSEMSKDEHPSGQDGESCGSRETTLCCDDRTCSRGDSEADVGGYQSVVFEEIFEDANIESKTKYEHFVKEVERLLNSGQNE